jgi:DNA-binding GntR family transcriptional regulator
MTTDSADTPRAVAPGGAGPAGARPLPNLALHRTSAAEQVADRLTGLILEGQLRSGDRLRESALSQSLGISRNSVREGIRLLEQGRLVRYEMHRGAVVATPTVAELDDLYRTRLHLETLAAGAVATPERVAGLDAAFERLVAAAHTRQPREIVAADMGFHAELIARLESARLSAFFESIATEMGFYLLILSHVDEEPEHVDEAVLAHHRHLVDTLRSGDVHRAQRAVREHLQQNHDRIRDILEKNLAAPSAR